MINNYIICATPRSGSNLLCEILSSLGFAGNPAEHFWDPPGSEVEPLADRWPHVLQSGTCPDGVFGTKLMWYQAERLQRELPAVVGMPDEPLTRIFATILDDPKYVYLTRRDRVRQAVSLVRAMQTGQWRSMDPEAGAPKYNAEAISREIEFLLDDERNWEGFFARNALAPYRLTYEDLDSAPQDTVAGLLAFLGHRGSLAISLRAARHQRQADDATGAWVSAYRAEQTTR